MDLNQLSAFIAVAEEGQFTRAASRLAIAQPAVSAHIRRLERELGEQLFYRERPAVRLTPAGAVLLPHAKAAIASTERARDEIAALRGLLRGSLRIGVAGPMDDRLVAALGAFHRAHPAVTVSLRNADNASLLAAIVGGDIDAGLVGVGAQPVPTQVRTAVVDGERLVAALPPHHAWARRATVPFDALHGEPVVTLPAASGLRRILEDAAHQRGFELDIFAEAADLPSLLALAREGLGIAVVPRSAAEGSDLIPVPVTHPALKRRSALAWHATAVSPAARSFVTLATRHLRRGTAVAPVRADGPG